MLAQVSSIIADNPAWLVAGFVVIVGLLIYGFYDLRRFSFGRAWAISGVCFAESIRRRVLWITPLAILGVLAVSQLQNPLDEQDAIRQTIKFSLFASGVVVTITTLILACTNLPKEIDTRVIYTIVTKPTNRLEIIVGKVIGFSKVSATILLIMGAFTMVYLHVREWSFRRDIHHRLTAGTIDTLSRLTYEYWDRRGLLSSRTFERPVDFNVFSRDPMPGDTKRWIFGGYDGSFVAPFHLPLNSPTVQGILSDPARAAMGIQLLVGFDLSKYGVIESTALDPQIGVALPGSATQPTALPDSVLVNVQILDPNFYTLVDNGLINGGEPIKLTDATGKTPVRIFLPPEGVLNLLRSPQFYVSVSCSSSGVELFADIQPQSDPQKNAISIIVPDPATRRGQFVSPSMPDAKPDEVAKPNFRAPEGLAASQRLRGGKPDQSPVAIYEFHGNPQATSEHGVAFELNIGIERTGEADQESDATRLQVVAVNPKTGQRGTPVSISPESNRTTYFSLPVAGIGDDFDIHIRNLSPGQYANFKSLSLAMVASEESFNGNLFRSLLILWMLSILVIIISIFCSTFLSWPIAVILSLLILLGHWGVMQVSDSLAPGIGNQVAQELFAADNANQARLVSQYVEAMSKMLNTMGEVLPDITRFAAIDDIEKGVTISRATLLAPLGVLAVFGVPMVVLGYVFLRNKEVAP